ncbi:MAG: hypothetical protein AB4352_29520 [Hormoscilla sp.]
MSIEYYMLHAATAIAQGNPQYLVPVSPGSIVIGPGRILSLIVAGLIFLGISAGGWWLILSKLGYQGKIRLFWLIGLVLFPINAIVMIAFALLPWPKSTAPQSERAEE